MKLFLLTEDLSDGGPIWMNVLWPTVRIYSECFDLTMLQVPRSGAPRGHGALGKFRSWRRIRSQRPVWTSQVLRELDQAGPNLLLVWARSSKSVSWSHALEPVWHLFSHRILHVLDTMQPEHVSVDDLARFDLVTCFCHDLADAYRKTHHRPTLFLPEHVDTMAFHNVGDCRPLDLLVVGRREDRYHLPLYTHFNAPEQKRVFVDLATRGQTPMTREQEFRILMSAHAKAAAAFCYETAGVPRFRGRSPMLTRWVHAWTSGCTVFGTRPQGGGTGTLMDWPGSTIELPSDEQDAIALVEETLADKAGMALRRHRNVLESLRRHDTRYRIAQMLQSLDLPIPAPLATGLERLDALAERLSTGGETSLAAAPRIA